MDVTPPVLKMPQNTFLTKIGPNFFIFLPRIVPESLISASPKRTASPRLPGDACGRRPEYWVRIYALNFYHLQRARQAQTT